MKRIEFIAPVESMRGNLGSKQSLYYNPNNNRAYDSIEGQINPALNYEPRLIGARGKRNYFCVKTKSSVHLTQRAKAAMSNLGGVGAIYSALVRNKMSNVYINAYGCYQDALAGGFIGSFRKYMYSFIQAALDAKDATINISTPNHSVSINNPWVVGGNGAEINVSYSIIAKFFNLLCVNKIEFTLETPNGIFKLFGQANMLWGEYVKKNWNELGLFKDENTGVIYYPYRRDLDIPIIDKNEDETPVYSDNIVYQNGIYTA